MTDKERADLMAQYKRARERHMVLSECLLMVEAVRRRFSRNEAAMVPKEGYELAFDGEQRRLEVLQELLREERAVIVRCMRKLNM
jgi:hypothetical protein